MKKMNSIKENLAPFQIIDQGHFWNFKNCGGAGRRSQTTLIIYNRKE